MKIEESLKIFLNENKENLKITSYKKYVSLSKRINKHIGELEVENLTQKNLQNLINELELEKASVSLMKASVTLLKSCIYYFCPKKSFRKLNYPKQKKQPSKCYSTKAIQKIKDYIIKEKKQNGYTLAILIAIYTGMRISEILGLQWQDIDFKQKIINVSNQLQNVGGGGKTLVSLKTTSSYRQIPIHKDLFKILKNQKNDYDFVCQKNGKPISVRSVQYVNEQICKELGLACKGLHAYRHHFATSLIMKTKDIKSVSEILGHSSITITQNIYNNPNMKQKQNVINAF